MKTHKCTSQTIAPTRVVLALTIAATSLLMTPFNAIADGPGSHGAGAAGGASTMEKQMPAGMPMDPGQMNTEQSQAPGGAHRQESMMGEMMGMGTAPMSAGMPGGSRQMGDRNRVVAVSHLSVDAVRHFFEHRLEAQGFSKLEVGTVAPREDGVIAVEITTPEGTVVQAFEVDEHTGRFRQAP